LTTDFMSVKTGDVLPVLTVTVTREGALRYLASTGEDDAHWPGIVPPLAIGALGLAALMEEMPLPAGVFHSSQEFEFLGAVPFDSEIELLIAVERRAERAGAIYTTVGLELRFEEEMVCRGHATVVLPPAFVPAALAASALASAR
jgi:hypothetical protein